MNKRASLKSLIIIFLIISVFFSALAIFSWSDYSNIKNNYIKTEANIIEINFDEDVYVTFYINEELKQVKLADYSEEWKIGDVIEIYYNPNNYLDAYSSELLLTAPIILTCFTGFFVLLLLIVAIIDKKRKEKINWLYENGRKVYAKVINFSSNFDMFSQNSFSVVCEFNGLIFKQNVLSVVFNNMNNLKDCNLANKKIAVYYNFENPKQYYLDFDDIIDSVEQ